MGEIMLKEVLWQVFASLQILRLRIIKEEKRWERQLRPHLIVNLWKIIRCKFP